MSQRTIRRWGEIFALCLFTFAPVGLAIEIHPYLDLSARRLELIQEYCKLHYGMETSELVSPQMIVVHATESPTLADAKKYFESDFMTTTRTYQWQNGEVNAGAHFLVDRNGDVYSLLPLNVIGRHALGFNYTAVGIENVGYTDKLTPEQLKADTELIEDLMHKLPSVHYLVGNMECSDARLPHYKLFIEKVSEYHSQTPRVDPGPEFMARLREELKKLTIELEK